MTADLNEVMGFRGEKILELGLTDYQTFAQPLFRPGFLGDKWPSVDFYVELLHVQGRKPFFLAQAKSTAGALSPHDRAIRISSKKKDIAGLLQIPGPTYIFGIHEPSRRVFVRSVHRGTPVRAITRIPMSHELTPRNLRKLYDEVQAFWKSPNHKPQSSVFA
ncbi:MAG TPA: hypothetical protein VGJ21_09475 [Terracidiphilus sp.]|jgi:hypothetical protein